MSKDKPCSERIRGEYQSEMETIKELWKSYLKFGEEFIPAPSDNEGSNIWEHGLSFDYVSPGTFKEQGQGYFRWQISSGGPSDEFRYYVNPDFSCYFIEYAFLDWFDGATLDVKEHDKEGFKILKEIYEEFRELGTVEAEYQKAMEL